MIRNEVFTNDKKEVTKVKNKGKRAILAIQHVIAMFGATVLVPILTGLNPAVALLAAGVGTLLFHFVTKGKVPVFLGSSFAFIPVIIAVGDKFGSLAYAQGGIMVAGALYLLLSLLIMVFGVDRVKSFFPPVVTGPMIIVIGLILSPTAIEMASANWLVAFIVIATVMVFSIFGKGMFKVIPILCGVIVGYAVSAMMNIIDFSAVTEASLFHIPDATLPKFDLGAIAMIAPIVLAVFMEHIGDITTNGSVVGKNFFKDPGLHRTLMGDGLATMFAGFIGAPPNTTYGENTSVLAVTKNYDPSILRLAAIFAIALSFIGKVGAILQTIPAPVMGGVSIILFGMISSVGIRTISNADIDFSNNRNLIIVSIILVAGIGTKMLDANPDFHGTIGIQITENIQIIGLSLAALIGVIANKILPEIKNEEVA
ncbi:uracil-xanthine permease family protein [Sporosalibacterium faouarense]|uniref:uracil-xanthine permease family protein n=1 Tax=Sporosalibacterium faouarense TaxID=516123 RepID=UPI00141CC6B8|nr:uracil-xanthine permease family protein [Sporosalibacterium faouarense]MTI47748.1 uracil-xanthine permease [Bacillota bacterium]